ncbi:MAG: formate C-acetyltransferase [Candidatus Berkelbacteria bacterium]
MFKGEKWQKTIDVRDFIINNMTAYDGDEKFLVGPTKNTTALWTECLALMKKERESLGGVLDIDTEVISTITSHKPGYIDKKIEEIVGLQTDAPLKRGIKPFGGIRVVEKACEEYGRKVKPEIVEMCTKYRKTHNDGVFDVYTPEIRALRSQGIITGLPDNYARGRIIGDYRRIALYGVDKLIAEKTADKAKFTNEMTDEVIRLREEITEQIKALNMMKEMAASYGFDISKPAESAKEAVQWTYFAYLSALKEHDGAAMSLGNVSSFLDIFIEKDLKAGKIDEATAQEYIDQFIIKLRLVRHLRAGEYNDLFAGDPSWLTESLGGSWDNGMHKVTKTTFRFLHTLDNLGPSPEPNLTVLWSKHLPENFKNYCAKVSVKTSSIQFENDDLMKKTYCYDDYAISCCVSLLKTGKMMQFFGARCNIAKVLLMAINGGRDEISGVQIVPNIPKLSSDTLEFDEVYKNYLAVSEYIAKQYVSAMNIIHYMHDKYYYERAQMALLDSEPDRVMAFGAAGLSVVADSFSAIKFAKVKVIRNEEGLSTGFETEGEYPKYGNDDDKVDDIAQDLVVKFNNELKKHHIYKNAKPTLSILTITSNVVYGKKTGSTPDGRNYGDPFAPGANPMHGRDTHGAIASLNSVAKLSYESAQDGISNTITVIPNTLGLDLNEQIENLVSLINGYFTKNAHHLNVNVLDKATLLDAVENPEKYPQLTIRVSGYAVNFIKLSKKHQMEVIARTFHSKL